jgi:hypothetical protein
MLLVAGGAAANCEVIPKAVDFRGRADLLQFSPQPVQIEKFLLSAPSVKRVVRDGLKILDRSGR